MKETIQKTRDSLETLARETAMMQAQIASWFKDPENERAYREWYLKKFGQAAPNEQGKG